MSISDAISFVVGLIIAIRLLEPILKYLRYKSTESIKLHSRLPARKNGKICYEWEQITKKADTPGAWIGRLERFLFFTAFWISVDAALKSIGVWLAFKVRCKMGSLEECHSSTAKN